MASLIIQDSETEQSLADKNGGFMSVDKSGLFPKGRAQELRRMCARADLQEMADAPSEVLEGDLSKDQLIEKFIEAVINLGDGDKIFAMILAERMELARKLGLIPPEAGAMNLAGFILSGTYAIVKNVKLEDMPQEAELIETLADRLFHDPGQALYAIAQGKEKIRRELAKFEPALFSPEIHELRDGKTSIQYIPELEDDRREIFVDKDHPEPTTLAAISVDGWLEFCAKLGWLEGLDSEISRTGPHAFIIEDDGIKKIVKASASMPGMEDPTKLLCMDKKFNWPVLPDAPHNIAKMLRQGGSGFNTAPLEMLDPHNLSVSDLVNAINACKKIDTAGREIKIKNDELLRLLLSDPSLRSAFQAIRGFSKLRKSMAIDGTFAVTEFYPFGWLLEIAQCQYRRQQKEDILCYEVLAEKFIDDGRGRDQRLPTDVIYTSVPAVEGAFECTDPDLVKKIITKMLVMDPGAQHLPMYTARQRIRQIHSIY